MVIVGITPRAGDTPVLVCASSMKQMYVALRGLPYAKLEVHEVKPGVNMVEYNLPADQTSLVARLLAESDKGDKEVVVVAAYYPLGPAYGRMYKTSTDARTDWDEGKDFRILVGPDAGRYCSKRDAAALLESGYTMISIMLMGFPDFVYISLDDAE